MLARIAWPFQGSFAGELCPVNGVKIDGLHVGGMDRAGVDRLLDKYEAGLGRTQIGFILPGEINKPVLDLKQAGIKIDRQRIWNEAVAVGRTGTWWRNLVTRRQVRSRGREIPVYYCVEKTIFHTNLLTLTEPWQIKAQDARFRVTPQDKVEIVAEVEGRRINTEKAYLLLSEKLQAGEPVPAELTLEYSPVKPEKTRRDLESYGLSGRLSVFTTSFNPQKLSRSENIRLAAGKLDGLLLKPQEVFSFNDAVGPRTKETGYDEADIILNNELVPGIGGGVCQVSTTLYNAVLLAGLKIEERHPHSLAIPYVEAGLDAAVVYNGKDLKFRNNTDTYLMLKTAVANGSLSIKIFGRPVQNRKIVLATHKEKDIPPKTVYREDYQVPRGKYILDREGRAGCIVKVERLLLDEKGAVVGREFISRDKYAPIDRIIKTYADSPLLSNYPEL